jgi:hypothetical protein
MLLFLTAMSIGGYESPEVGFPRRIRSRVIKPLFNGVLHNSTECRDFVTVPESVPPRRVLERVQTAFFEAVLRNVPMAGHVRNIGFSEEFDVESELKFHSIFINICWSSPDFYHIVSVSQLLSTAICT